MEKAFWQNKWDNNELGFHQLSVNPLLEENLQHLKLPPTSRVFIPLCGKTLDISWLLSKGFAVVGIEMVEEAVIQLFDELGVIPTMTSKGPLKHYSADKLEVYVGDIFNLSQLVLGKVDAIYDRAALVALPYEIREKYAAHVINITLNAPQLLVSFVYDQNMMSGPPFSVTDTEVNGHYTKHYEATLLAADKVKEPVKGHTQIQEKVWLLTPKANV